MIVVLKSYDRTIFSMILSDYLEIFWWECLMNNEVVKVYNEPRVFNE